MMIKPVTSGELKWTCSYELVGILVLTIIRNHGFLVLSTK